jgi:dihydropyrimidinase
MVQTVGSDHVAFLKKQKEDHCETFMDIPNGFPGIEVRLPVVFQEGVQKRNLSLEKFAEVTATNAAKLFGYTRKKGY